VSELITPSQTVGPFFAMRLPWPEGPFVVPEGTPGAITIVGRVLDGAGYPVPDALIETWQADPEGRFAHPDDPRGASVSGYRSFRGFGRCPTSPDGSYRIVTLKPGPLPCPEADGGAGGGMEAPHLNVSVFARGMLDRVVTRMYFPDEAEANAADPVLSSLPEPDRRGTLIAVPVDVTPDPEGPGVADGPDGAGGGVSSVLRFDVRLQGDNETVFFDV
jgi:protocatechuate 3,4-dioxygenase alpha subunit